jgi:hypothetical protein
MIFTLEGDKEILILYYLDTIQNNMAFRFPTTVAIIENTAYNASNPLIFA